MPDRLCGGDGQLDNRVERLVVINGSELHFTYPSLT